MLAGLPDTTKKELGLSNVVDWTIASVTDCQLHDETDFKSTCSALHQLGLSHNMQELWNLLAAVLHLGNVTFVPLADKASTDCRWTADETYHLDWAARLLGLSSHDLLHVFTVRYIQAGSTAPVLRPCSTETECNARRDTLIRLLYRLTFDMVLDCVNQKLRNAVDPARIKLKYLCKI